jgi:putative ABC transport system permease protein
VWAALRYRGAQTAALVLLSALVTACAVLAPLYARALEQGLLQSAIFRASAADTALVVSAGRTATAPDLGIADVLDAVPAKARELHEEPIGQLYARGSVRPRQGLMPSPLEMAYRDRVCDHLTLVAGACPRQAGQVAVSAKDLQKWGWRVGQAFTVPVSGAPSGTPPVTLTIAGAYEVRPDPAYWLRTQLDGRSGTLVGGGNDPVPALDTWVLSEPTFDKAFPNAQITVALPLKRDAITLDSLPEAAQAAAAVRSTSGNVTADSPVPGLLDQVRSGQGQVRVIVPILMVQLGLLAAVVLLTVASAAVDQRRPEVALARLRGRSREGARRLVLGELGLTVLLGLPLGTAMALALSELARRFVLPVESRSSCPGRWLRPWWWPGPSARAPSSWPPSPCFASRSRRSSGAFGRPAARRAGRSSTWSWSPSRSPGSRGWPPGPRTAHLRC